MYGSAIIAIEERPCRRGRERLDSSFPNSGGEPGDLEDRYQKKEAGGRRSDGSGRGSGSLTLVYQQLGSNDKAKSDRAEKFSKVYGDNPTCHSDRARRSSATI